MKKIPMTLLGAKKLREELDYLKSVRRTEIIKSLIEARAHGDLKENAEYQAAKEQQGFCEGRIREIEYKLSSANIIDVTHAITSNKVVFGAIVNIENLSTGYVQSYRIVGDDESNLKKNMISINSPIARGLIGYKEGDVVLINTPKGTIQYKIIAVRYFD